MITFSQFFFEAKRAKGDEDGVRMYTLEPEPKITPAGSSARKKQIDKLIRKHKKAFKKIKEQVGLEYTTPYNSSIQKSAGIAKRRQISHAHSEMQRTATQERRAHLKRLNQLTDR